MKEGGDRGFLGQLVNLVDELPNTIAILLTGLWDEDHVTLHVASGFVVLAVGNLPGEVRDEESRVTEPAGSVVENLRGGERLVATLVSEDPETSTKETLDDCVDSPEPSAYWSGRDIFRGDEFVEEQEGDCETGDIPSNIAQTPQARSLEAVLRNCISNIIDGEVWKFELVSVGIKERAVTLLLHII